MKKTALAAAFIMTLFFTACANTSSSESTIAPAAASAINNLNNEPNSSISKVKKGTLLFFINPDGAPCQMQNSILNGALSSISGTVDVQYIKTTNPGDNEAFYTYSIRGLPSMIIIDNNNQIIKRFSPGIQSGDTIVQAVKEL